MARETEGLVRSGHSGRTEEWRDPEPAGEDQPEADRAPNATLTGGVPEGITPAGVEERSELAAHLGKEIYPAYRDALVDRLVETNAPGRLVTAVRDLPPDAEYQNAGELAEALGLGHESHRF
ncbi:DUF2795 domain-containing protein [Cryptosporangium aurantiacum]|uniref:DUF2795 domain-containing protein n=1 Tax=Cryptosporangium aurantiacum TaxID=134849 RepID=A0A1M7QA13_9ACTN|nr:DUF2795 domain-containing protein [Cryptosporangium aurantiacum]SHN27414.1 Protein of unknown function [Cryptosporangium aurantiacum]